MFDFLKNNIIVRIIRKILNLVIKYPIIKLSGQKIAKKNGYIISENEAKELYNEINFENNYSNTIIKASKSGVNISLKDAEKIYTASQNSKKTFQELVENLIAAKKADPLFSINDIISLTKEQRNLKKITEAISFAKKEGIIFSAADIKTLFYKNENDFIELAKQFCVARDENLGLNEKQIKILYLKNIKIENAIKVLQLSKRENLKLSFNVLVSLLKEDINIVKCIKILSKAKKACYAELQNCGMFNSEVNDKLANVYVIDGKNEFKKKLSENILILQKMLDPADVYISLVKSKGKGFKISLETIQDYITFDYTSDLEKIHDSYLYARENGLYLSFKHLAKLAEKKVDVLKFVNAQINSGYYE